MGVKFTHLIKSKPIGLSELKGSRVAIDGMNMLFQLLYNPYYSKNYKNGATWKTDGTQRIYHHLYGWIQKAIQFLNSGILPVVVFDGRPDIRKRLKYRNKQSDYVTAKSIYKDMMECGNLNQAKKISLGYNYMFRNCVEESIRLLKACGIPVIIAPSEAECQCVYFQKQGLVDYVVSTDFDVVLYGATKVLRKITFSSRKKINGKSVSIRPMIDNIEVPAELERIDFSREQLIDMSFLIGNDYFEGIRGIGEKTAQKLIREYGSLFKIMENPPEKHIISLRKLHVADFLKIKQLFLNPIVKHYSAPFYIQPFSPNIIKQILLLEHKLGGKRIENYIPRMEKAVNKISKYQNFVSSTVKRYNYIEVDEKDSINSSNYDTFKGNNKIHPIKSTPIAIDSYISLDGEEKVIKPWEYNHKERHEFGKFMERRLKTGKRDPEIEKKIAQQGYSFTQATYVVESPPEVKKNTKSNLKSRKSKQQEIRFKIEL